MIFWLHPMIQTRRWLYLWNTTLSCLPKSGRVTHSVPFLKRWVTASHTFHLVHFLRPLCPFSVHFWVVFFDWIKTFSSVFLLSLLIWNAWTGPSCFLYSTGASRFWRTLISTSLVTTGLFPALQQALCPARAQRAPSPTPGSRTTRLTFSSCLSCSSTPSLQWHFSSAS